MTGVDKAVPNLALLRNLDQRIVQVADMNAGADILLGKGDQTAALQGGHFAGHLFRAGGLNQLRDRAIKDALLEPIEAVSHVD